MFPLGKEKKKKLNYLTLIFLHFFSCEFTKYKNFYLSKLKEQLITSGEKR